jgi:hypothetical protein
MMANNDVVNGKSNDYDGTMSEPDRDWTAEVKRLLKAELKRRGVTYAQLVEKLQEIGVRETEVNLRNKIARGGFTAVFLIQCMTAIGTDTIRISLD